MGRHLNAGVAEIAAETSEHWCTPLAILDGVRRVFGARIDLDPCTNTKALRLGHVDARVACAIDGTDGIVGGTEVLNLSGLEADWTKAKNVYVNPPYGRGLNETWAEKYAASRVECIALVPASTGSRWFRRYVDASKAVSFIGRVRFEGAKSVSPFELAMFYRGRHAERFQSEFFPHKRGKYWGFKK